MRENDLYIHFNGGEYQFISIAVPLEHHTELNHTPTPDFKAIDEATLKEVTVYSRDGVYFSESNVFMVLYQRKTDNTRWLRPVDDFFGYKKHEDGSFEKRFTLQEVNGVN